VAEGGQGDSFLHLEKLPTGNVLIVFPVPASTDGYSIAGHAPFSIESNAGKLRVAGLKIENITF
jgi:hypothetical protein